MKTKSNYYKKLRIFHGSQWSIYNAQDYVYICIDNSRNIDTSRNYRSKNRDLENQDQEI